MLSVTEQMYVDQIYSHTLYEELETLPADYYDADYGQPDATDEEQSEFTTQ